MMRTPAQLEVKRAAREFADWLWFGRKHGCVMYGLVAARGTLECACATARAERKRRAERGRIIKSPYPPLNGFNFDFWGVK